MKILHIAPISPYNVGWSYQDNLLPAYQRKLGHEVRVVVSPFENTPNGKVDVGESDFILPDGVHVYRRRRWLGNGPIGKAVSFTDVWDILTEYKPDLVMIHSLMTLTVYQVIKYKKKHNPNCVIIHDNHLDENIGFKKNKILTDLFYGYWSVANHFAKPYISKYYGVTPWRRDFIVNRFKIKPENTDVLIMGADMDKIHFDMRETYRAEIDKKYGTKGKFLIVTGGKIERNKSIAPLMQAVDHMDNVKLLVFGSVADDYLSDIESSKNENTVLMGWMDIDHINELLLAADLAVFPGQHSVLWEQACACKIPCVFRFWQGMDHLNNGGNAEFIPDEGVDTLRKEIQSLMYTSHYQKMLAVARSDATDVFSYVEIAKKSLETAYI